MSLGWPYKCRSSSNSGIYGESNVPSCYKSSTFDEAVEICSAYDGESFLQCLWHMDMSVVDHWSWNHISQYHPSSLSLSLSHTHKQHTGGRLCTGAEILDRCTAGTGCSLNKALVWACSANSASCTASAECCSGLCNGGVCEDVNGPDTSSPSTSPTKGPTLAVSSYCVVFVWSFYFSNISLLMYLWYCIYHPQPITSSPSANPTSSPSLKPTNSPSTSVRFSLLTYDMNTAIILDHYI